MPSSHCHRLLRKLNSGSGWLGGCSGSGRRMPLGRPVVPEEYSIAVPSDSSATGVPGRPASAVSWSSTRAAPAWAGRWVPPSTTRHRLTRGQLARASAAVAKQAAEVISTCASLLFRI